MVQRSVLFKTTHTGWYLSAKAYGEVRRFETTLYGALFRGQSKKRYLHALFYNEFLRRTITVIIYEAYKTGKISTANMNDIMIDRDWELWFEGEKSVAS